MRLAVIAAVAENGVIGRGGALPWHLPADLKRFKELTTGHAIVMGRKTWESIGRALPGRRSVVISRDPGFRPDGAEVARSLDEALVLVRDEERAFVVGGAAIYREALPRADELYLTRVHATVEGDVSFPGLDEAEWALVEETRRAADDRNAYPLSFQVYRRR